MNNKLELYITILVAIILDALLIVVFISIEEFPMWAKILTYTLFNVVIGMVFMAVMIKTQEDSTK